MKPFLKWAGGKYRLVDLIKKNLPEGNRLIEPFVGSGALFLNTEYSANLLADSNPDLISLFKYLQKEGQGFISYCQGLFVAENNTELAFYQLREEFNTTNDLRRKAALFVYLNRHCFNGLCRCNSKGGFNVPYGRYTKPTLPEKEMFYFYEKSKNAVFEVAGFMITIGKIKTDDIDY
jgi:DNA adenine methylase